MVWNLLSNAVKFTPPEGSVTVRLMRKDGYVLTVQDSGAGIEPTFLPHVFDAFRQADGSATREHGGLGLGLAIARQLVEAHGGTIQARSAGHGHRARRSRCSCPRSSRRSNRRAAPAEAATVETVDASLLSGVDVLVVDDDEDARLLLQMTLSRYGAAVVTTAGSAREALAAIDRARPARGPQRHRDAPRGRLRSAAPAARAARAEQGGTIPAVAVTAYASATDRSSTQAAGYQAHVAKPFEPGDIARLVRRLRRLRQSGRARGM